MFISTLYVSLKTRRYFQPITQIINSLNIQLVWNKLLFFCLLINIFIFWLCRLREYYYIFVTEDKNSTRKHHGIYIVLDNILLIRINNEIDSYIYVWRNI